MRVRVDAAALASRDFEGLISLVGSDIIESMAGPSRMLVALASIKRSHPTFYDHDGDGDTGRIVFSFLC